MDKLRRKKRRKAMKSKKKAIDLYANIPKYLEYAQKDTNICTTKYRKSGCKTLIINITTAVKHTKKPYSPLFKFNFLIKNFQQK